MLPFHSMFAGNSKHGRRQPWLAPPTPQLTTSRLSVLTGAFWFLRSLWPLRTLWPFNSLGPLNPFSTICIGHLRLTRVVAPLLTMLTARLIRAIKPADFTTGVGAAILTSILASIGLTILLTHITRLRYAHLVPSATTAIAVTTPTRTTVGRPRTAVVTSTTATVTIPSPSIPASIISCIETEAVKLSLQCQPLGISQRRGVDPFQPRPQLSFFAPDSCPQVVTPKGHISLGPTRRRNDR